MEKKRMKYRQRQNFFKTDAWKRFRKNKLALVGTAVILLLILAAVFAPVIAQNDPYVSLQDGNTVLKNMSPSKSHTILGTDSIGRDGFSRLVYAARVSMSVGLVAVGISTVIGIVLGAIAGYFGGVADTIIMRCVDVVNCFPVLFLIIIVATILKPSIYNVMIIIGLCNWTGTARLVRGEILRVREMVGCGVQLPTASWGNMLMDANNLATLTKRPWQWIPAGACIFLAVLSINFIGDGLRDAFDVKQKK